MKKIVFVSVMAFALMFACEKEVTGPAEASNPDETVLKSALIKNEVIEEDVLASLYAYFEGMELKDYDMMRSVTHENFYSLEQGVLCNGVEEHIAWFESLGMPPAGAYEFQLDIEEVFIKGNMAWVVCYDHLYIGGTNVWNGLESGTFLKDKGVWKWVMMTVTNLNPCPN